MTKNTEKTEQFNPAKHLRFAKEIFIHEDRVVGERKRLQYQRPDYGYWYNIETEETMTKLHSLLALEHYDAIVMKPGIKEEIQALKDEEDDD